MSSTSAVRTIHLFCEDNAHEVFLTALLQRLATEHGIQINIHVASAIGGHGRALSELRQYIRELQRSRGGLPDLLVVAIDGNCKGYVRARQEVREILGDYSGATIYAIPDPHVERWLLLDSAAFKEVLGVGCAAPDQKCERGRYKRLLAQAVRQSGITPLLGGIEYTDELVAAMDLPRLKRLDDSLGKLLDALDSQFKEWEQADGSNA
jgi:hypothetical protein